MLVSPTFLLISVDFLEQSDDFPFPCWDLTTWFCKNHFFCSGIYSGIKLDNKRSCRGTFKTFEIFKMVFCEGILCPFSIKDIDVGEILQLLAKSFCVILCFILCSCIIMPYWDFPFNQHLISVNPLYT